MHPRKLFLLGLLVVAHHACAAPLAASSDPWFGPIPTPIPDANPAVREVREVLVPTEIEAYRNHSRLVVGDASDTLKAIKLKVGSKMIVGMSTSLFIFPAGGVRPAQFARMSFSPPPVKGTKGMSFFYPKPDGFLQPGKPFVLEMDVTIFETDIPQGHLSMPGGGKYKVLWQTTLRKTPEEMDQLPREIREVLERAPKAYPLPVER